MKNSNKLTFSSYFLQPTSQNLQIRAPSEKPGHWTVCPREFDTIKAARKALALEIKQSRAPSGLDIKNL